MSYLLNVLTILAVHCMWVYHNTINYCLNCLEFWHIHFWVKYRGQKKYVRVGTKSVRVGTNNSLQYQLQYKKTRDMLLVKNDRVISKEKFRCKEILAESLCEIGCNNKATRNWVLGSGQFFNTKERMQVRSYGNNIGKCDTLCKRGTL